MTTATLTMNDWNVEYYQTMKTTARARRKVVRSREHAAPHHVRFFAEVFLWYPFFAVTRDTTKLVSLLEEFEAYPSSVLLEEDVEKMPQELQNLFKNICRVIQLTEGAGLRDGLLLKYNITKLSGLTQQIKGYADRFADAQNKLRSRVDAEQVEQYRESFAAYGSCEPEPEQFTADDVKSTLLRF
jgi:hypothetical protein